MKTMQKVLCVALAAAVLTCAGCSSKPDATQQPTEPAADTQVQAASTVVGEVEAIVGNEVTLKLGEVDESAAPQRPADGEMPEGMEFPKDGEMPEGMEFPSGGEMPEGMEFPGGGDMPEGFERPEGGDMPEGFERPEGGQMPEGGFGGGRGQGGAGFGQAVDIELTGETATYILPVGMRIGSGDYSDVTEGMVLRLSLDEGGNVVACDVLSR